jgi:hypothetical protein
VENKLWFFGTMRRSGFDRELLDAYYQDGTRMLNRRAMPFWLGKLSYQMNQANRFSGFHEVRKARWRVLSADGPCRRRDAVVYCALYRTRPESIP